MQKSLVREAAEAFSNGNYAVALEIYIQLAEKLGERNFKVNIALCKKRMITAPKDIGWIEVKVIPGCVAILSGGITCNSKTAQKSKSAVALFKCFDEQGQDVDYSCGKLSKSNQFKTYFKYAPCTNGKTTELHRFEVPDGVSLVKACVQPFNNAQIIVDSLSIQVSTEKPASLIHKPPSKQAAEISILGWPEYPANGKPYVIGVMDEFTTGCFEQDLNLIQPRPDNWYALAEKYRPELFFIESAWKGNNGSWQYRVADYTNKPGQEIAEICQYARNKGIPTIFWNKEDPVHHDKFMCSAQLVDHIFTTDTNMKASYIAKTGNINVHTLPFAAQPALHKPSSLTNRVPRSCFAGSWYGNRHEERGKELAWLLQAANKHGLDIYDRNYGTGNFTFPDEYQQGIKGSLPYKELCNEYRRYRVFLNVNSVTDSPTMFSRRVFELMACGTPVVSTYAKGMDNLFESGAVWMVRSQEEADQAIHTLMYDDTEWRRRSLLGIREVFARHTYAHRLNDMFKLLGIETRMPTAPPILLIAQAADYRDLLALNRFANMQQYSQFRLGIECPQGVAAMASHLANNVTLLQSGEKSEWVTKQQAEYTVAGWIMPDSYYGEHYLRDLANATLYEPDASGWAKAHNQDTFDYGGKTTLGASLWKTQIFTSHFINKTPSLAIHQQDLYLSDSDQYQAANVIY